MVEEEAMKKSIQVVAVFTFISMLLWANKTDAFTISPVIITQHDALKISTRLFTTVNDGKKHDEENENESIISMKSETFTSRRRLLASLSSAAAVIAAAATTTMVLSSSPALADVDSIIPQKKTKILVLGGTGLVGAQVVRTLKEMGIETIATSRDGRDGTVALDFVVNAGDDNKTGDTDIIAQVSKLASGCSAVISCVGAVGTAYDYQVNAGTALAVQAAKSVGVERFVYISVAPEVQEFARDIEFLQNYMNGKTTSRNAVLTLFPDNKSTLIEPTFIYGGGSFNINPPRVTGLYGKIIEGLLSSSPIRSVERILSPGIIKIALEPPVSVESVAAAAVAGALGKSPLSILDSYDKIKQASVAI